MSDMNNNRVPYGLLTAEETAALHEHEQAGGVFEFTDFEKWKLVSKPTWNSYAVYRTVPLPKTQDVIAWDRLPKEAEWTARDAWGAVRFYEQGDTVEINVVAGEWDSYISGRRIDDFPGIVQIGTCDWKDSKQRRPK
jgi:hypothetical protein